MLLALHPFDSTEAAGNHRAGPERTYVLTANEGGCVCCVDSLAQVPATGPSLLLSHPIHRAGSANEAKRQLPQYTFQEGCFNVSKP